MSHNTEHNFSVLHLASAIEPPHIQKWLAEISSVLKPMGGKSYIPGRIGRAEPLLRHAGGTVIDAPLDGSKRTARERLKSLVAEENLVAYFCYDLHQVKMATELQAINQAPIVLTALDFIPTQKFLGFKPKPKELKKIDHFIAASGALKQQLTENLGIAPEFISLIHDGVDLASVSEENVSQARTFSLAGSWAAVEDPTEIITIEANYNSAIWRSIFLNFVQNWVQVLRPDVRFVLIGDDDGSGELAAMERTLLTKFPGAPFQVVGHCADIEAALKLSSAFAILPSEAHASFSTALTAQAIGRYTLLPECLAAYEFVSHGHSGLVLPPNADDYVVAIEQLLRRDESLRSSHSILARNFIQQNFSREIQHAKLRAVFEPEMA